MPTVLTRKLQAVLVCNGVRGLREKARTGERISWHGLAWAPHPRRRILFQWRHPTRQWRTPCSAVSLIISIILLQKLRSGTCLVDPAFTQSVGTCRLVCHAVCREPWEVEQPNGTHGHPPDELLTKRAYPSLSSCGYNVPPVHTMLDVNSLVEYIFLAPIVDATFSHYHQLLLVLWLSKIWDVR